MAKEALRSLAQKNQIYEAFIDRLESGSSFLVSGHADPDADCLATMLGVALLVRKMRKPATMVIGGSIPENLEYLLKIAEYNRIGVNEAPRYRPDTVVVCDTAKPDLLPGNDFLDEALSTSATQAFEIDHHLGSDSEYIADREHALVDRASSSGSLLARLVCKIAARGTIDDLFSRNLVIALLTGMMSDTQMGKVLPTQREARVYARMISFLSALLRQSTFSPDKFDSIQALYAEMVRLSEDEERLDNFFLERYHLDDAVAWVAIDASESDRLIDEFGADNLKSAARRLTDRMTGISGKIGMVSYVDENNVIQCRLRREYGYEGTDLRTAIEQLDTPDGGGHPGAVGFRFPAAEIEDFDALVARIVSVANTLAAAGT